jgi:hypothetical protein
MVNKVRRLAKTLRKNKLKSNATVLMDETQPSFCKGRFVSLLGTIVSFWITLSPSFYFSDTLTHELNAIRLSTSRSNVTPGLMRPQLRIHS